MYDYTFVPSLDTLTMEFKITDVKDDDHSTTYAAYLKNVNTGWAKLTQSPSYGDEIESSDDSISAEFETWTLTPMAKVGKRVEIVGKNMEELIDAYEELLVGAYMWTQYSNNRLDCSSEYSRMIDWLRTTDFYTAPASTRYHESFPGGLLVHTLTVYNNMIDLIKIPAFKDVSVAEATVCVLVHDWCKIGYYEAYQKNVKDEATGKWEKETAYRTNQTGIPLGHGVSSMYLATRTMRLTPEQALAIRHHMGRWNCPDNEMSELQKANSEFPLVYLVQFADELACTTYASKG